MLETISRAPHLWAAIALLVHVILMGLYMSVAFRLKTVLAKNKDEVKQILEGRSFKIVSNVQLNNSEWAPFFVACHFFLHTNSAGSAMSAILSVATCTSFTLFKAFIFPGKPAPVTATLRYLSLAYLVYEIALIGLRN
jgi:hypothetical protein